MELIVAKATLGHREYSVRVMRKDWFKLHVSTAIPDIADFSNFRDCMKYVKKAHGERVYKELMTYWREATRQPQAHGRMLEVLSEIYSRPPLEKENV